MELRSTKRRQRGRYRFGTFYAQKEKLCSHYSRFFPYTVKVTTEAAQGTKTKMEARNNEDVDSTRIVARFVSTRNSCRIFRCFSNCSSFYGAKRVLSSQTSVVVHYYGDLQSDGSEEDTFGTFHVQK